METNNSNWLADSLNYLIVSWWRIIYYPIKILYYELNKKYTNNIASVLTKSNYVNDENDKNDKTYEINDVIFTDISSRLYLEYLFFKYLVYRWRLAYYSTKNLFCYFISYLLSKTNIRYFDYKYKQSSIKDIYNKIINTSICRIEKDGIIDMTLLEKVGLKPYLIYLDHKNLNISKIIVKDYELNLNDQKELNDLSTALFIWHATYSHGPLHFELITVIAAYADKLYYQNNIGILSKLLNIHTKYTLVLNNGGLNYAEDLDKIGEAYPYASIIDREQLDILIIGGTKQFYKSESNNFLTSFKSFINLNKDANKLPYKEKMLEAYKLFEEFINDETIIFDEKEVADFCQYVVEKLPVMEEFFIPGNIKKIMAFFIFDTAYNHTYDHYDIYEYGVNCSFKSYSSWDLMKTNNFMYSTVIPFEGFLDEKTINTSYDNKILDKAFSKIRDRIRKLDRGEKVLRSISA
jgi:hypothetical protein